MNANVVDVHGSTFLYRFVAGRSRGTHGHPDLSGRPVCGRPDRQSRNVSPAGDEPVAGTGEQTDPSLDAGDPGRHPVRLP